MPKTPKQYALTGRLRRKLKKPMGELLVGDEIGAKASVEAMKKAAMVITVGDRVTDTLQELGRTPDIQVVDEMERRIARDAPNIPYKRLIRAKNPPGVITAEAMNAMESAFKGADRPARVLIEGEEDLLAIAAVMMAPLGSIVYYGQPKQGVVRIIIDQKKKDTASGHMDDMEPSY